MPIIPKTQAYVFEEKVDRINRIINNLHNEYDKQLLKNFIWELCRRYIDKSKELERNSSTSISELEKFERNYMETIIKDLNL